MYIFTELNLCLKYKYEIHEEFFSCRQYILLVNVVFRPRNKLLNSVVRNVTLPMISGSVSSADTLDAGDTLADTRMPIS
jgi:hypothetical protein